MTDQFSFLGDKHKAAIAVAMSLGVLLLLPSSLGFGGTMTMQEAYGQFNLPLLEDETVTEEEEDGEIVVEEEEEETTTTTTTPTTPAAPTTSIEDPSAYLMADRNADAMRGFIGSTLPTQGAGTLTASDNSGHVATGRFRVFANDSAVESFVTEMNVAAIDGSSFHNITIREGDPHRFEVTAGNGTAASSNIVGNIFLDGGTTPVIDNVPMTLTVRGQVLAIQGIDIDEARITDTGQRGIVSVIDGQTIYGTIPST
jgi:cytoskeletal protein RodZ